MAKIKHHNLSMSRWSALAVCPHFTPSPKPSEEAAEGTLAHENVATIYKTSAGADEARARASVFKYPQSAWCAAEWHKLKSCEDVQFMGNFAVQCAVECRLEIRETHPILDGIYGFADFVRILRDRETNSLMRISVADFKTFSNGTQVYDEQIAGYAVAVASTLPDATDETPVDLYTMHGATQTVTRTMTTLGECRQLALDVITKYLGRERFPMVTNKMCKYCKKCPCKGALAEVQSLVPNFTQCDISPKAMAAKPQEVPMMLAAIDDAQRVLDAAKDYAREVIKTYGRITANREGLSVYTLGDDDCAYAIKTQCGRKTIAAGVDNDRIIRLLGSAGKDEFIAAAKIGVKDLVKAVIKVSAEVLNRTVDEKEAESLLIDNGILSYGKAIEKLERVK